jgi:hypothetical protein
LLHDGRVLVAGGRPTNACCSQTQAFAEIYDPITGLWTETGSLRTARFGHTMHRMANGRVLVTGGYQGGAVLASTEIYDPTTGTWTYGAGMVSTRARHRTVMLHDGRILALGGGGAGASVERYDPATGTWSAVASAPYSPERGATLTVLADGRVLLAGGDPDAARSAAIYYPQLNQWITAEPMPRDLHRGSAMPLPDGVVFLAGLAGPIMFEQSGEWRVLPGGFGALDSAAVLLLDGRVLVAGGSRDNPEETGIADAFLFGRSVR